MFVGGQGLPAIGMLPAVGGDVLLEVEGPPCGNGLPFMGESLTMVLPIAVGCAMTNAERLPVVGSKGSEGVPFGGEGLPEMGSEGLPAVGGSGSPAMGGEGLQAMGGLGHQGLPVVGDEALPVLDSETMGGSLPAVGGDSVGGGHRRRSRSPARAGWRQAPWLRMDAMADIGAIAIKYGGDLGSPEPPPSWLDTSIAHQLLESRRWMALNKDGDLEPIGSQPVDFMEVFSGCGHLSLGVAQSGLRVGPSIDKEFGLGNGNCCVDICTAPGRQLVWALLVVFMPLWVHLAYPCTFWSWLAHITRRQDDVTNEKSRLQALMFIVFTRQVVRFQASRRRHFSFENPPRCVSWDLDIVQSMLSQYQMQCVGMDLCVWGAVDPGSGVAYKKAIKFACSFDISSLQRKCTRDHVHQKVEGVVASGPERGKRRSTISGRYPMPLCRAWAVIARGILSQLSR